MAKFILVLLPELRKKDGEKMDVITNQVHIFIQQFKSIVGIILSTIFCLPILTKEQACLKEQELIKYFNSIDRKFGYNSTSGGEHFVMNEETKQKISQSMKGNKNGFGHTCSEEKKKKISEAQKGKKLTKEHKQKLSEAAKNRHVPCSEEKKKKLSQSYPNKRKVYCEELNMIFDSVQECSRYIGAPATNISKVCRGKGKTVKGYHLKYYDDTINA